MAMNQPENYADGASPTCPLDKVPNISVVGCPIGTEASSPRWCGDPQSPEIMPVPEYLLIVIVILKSPNRGFVEAGASPYNLAITYNKEGKVSARDKCDR
jgi:hypothetical protein